MNATSAILWEILHIFWIICYSLVGILFIVVAQEAVALALFFGLSLLCVALRAYLYLVKSTILNIFITLVLVFTAKSAFIAQGSSVTLLFTIALSYSINFAFIVKPEFINQVLFANLLSTSTKIANFARVDGSLKCLFSSSIPDSLLLYQYCYSSSY